MNLRSRQTRAFLAGLIRSAQDRGEYRSEINADVKAAEILAFLVGLETQWVAEKSAIDLEPVFRSFVESLLRDLTLADAPKRRSRKA